MSEPGTWRSLRSVMLLTLHVAAIAAFIRYFNAANGRPSSLVVGVLLAIGLGSFVSWPVGRALFAAFRVELPQYDRSCPRCRRFELRPLIRPGQGIFEAVSAYRCAVCRSTIRIVDGLKQVEEPAVQESSPSVSGIRFLDESRSSDDIVFLDEP